MNRQPANLGPRGSARSRRRYRPRKGEQLLLPTHRRGGRRPGAGRPTKPGSGVRHLARPRLRHSEPLHVTLKLLPHVGSLRRKAMRRVVLRAFALGNRRFGFRLVHFSVQKQHLHLVCEAEGKRSLSRGLQGLTIRIAKALNKRLMRKGQVFADRYHARALRSPREVRECLGYVLGNWLHHGQGGRGELDPCSSALLCDGWKGPVVWRVEDLEQMCFPEGLSVAGPSRWLLRIGWKRAGPLDPDKVPGA